MKKMMDWLKDSMPDKPLMLSWSWKCDPEIWLAEKIKKLIEKVKK